MSDKNLNVYSNGSTVSLQDSILMQTVADNVRTATVIANNGDGTGVGQITDDNGNIHNEGVIFNLAYKVSDLFPDL